MAFEDIPRKSFNEIKDEQHIFIDPEIDLNSLSKKLATMWYERGLEYVKEDHKPGGAAEQAEFSIINPMIDEICAYAKSHQWEGSTIPEICTTHPPTGGEVPHILDVTDPLNPVTYNLNLSEDGVTGMFNINMGERSEITLQFHLENSILIENEVRWLLNFNGNRYTGSRQIVVKKDLLSSTGEIIYLEYQDTKYQPFTIRIK